MKYDMTNPCDLCPFRNDDKRLTVDGNRLREFGSGEFCCHKTGDHGESTISPNADSQHCAGLLIFLEKLEEPHQMMRICERLGMYDRSKLNMDAPIIDDWDEMT